MAAPISLALPTTACSAAVAAGPFFARVANTTPRTQKIWPIQRSRSAALVSATFPEAGVAAANCSPLVRGSGPDGLSARAGIAKPAAAAVPAARTRARRVRDFICSSCVDVGAAEVASVIIYNQVIHVITIFNVILR